MNRPRSAVLNPTGPVRLLRAAVSSGYWHWLTPGRTIRASFVSESASSIPAVFSPDQALRFLADIGVELTGSLDYDQTLRRVARLAVPALADWCAVYIAGEDGEEREITSGHGDPEVEATLRAIRRRRRETGESESQLVAESTEARLATDVRAGASSEASEQERQAIERLGPTSYMLVPLVARGRSIGALTFLAAREGRHYTDQDLAFARTVAGRCALAIDNARLYDAAERSLTLLDTVFATAPVGLGVVDLELRFARLNEALAGVFGRPVEDCVGRDVREIT
jgi:GAF domain-containing protein